MKINIKPKNCHFFIDENKRKVVCVIENTENLVNDFIMGQTALNYWFLPDEVINKLIMPNRFSGVATCAPEDTWDIEVGKAIAFSRAKYKLNTSFFKRANYLVNEIDRRLGRVVESFNAYGEHVDRNNNKREKWIIEKVGSEVFLGSHRFEEE